MYLSSSSNRFSSPAYSGDALPTFESNTPNDPGASIPYQPRSCWIINYPVDTSVAKGNNANPDLGSMLNFHGTADLKRGAEPIEQALMIIGTTLTGRMLLCDLSCKLNGRPISITRAIAGLGAPGESIRPAPD